MSLKAGDSFPQDVVFSYVTHHSSLFHLPAFCPSKKHVIPSTFLTLTRHPATSPGLRTRARSPPAVSPSTTTPPRNGLTRRSSSSLCLVRHRLFPPSSTPKVPLLTATPPAGAFTPVCSANHVPEYIQKLPELRAKGVDVVAVLAYNDAYVMSAWGKANGVTGDDIVRPLYLPPTQRQS